MLQRLCLLLAALVLAGCSMLPSVPSTKGASLCLKVQFESGYTVTAEVNNYTKSSINHLVLKFFTIAGETESPVMSGAAQVSRDVRGAYLDVPMLIANLKANTTYRVRCYAYKAAGTAPGDLISKSTSFADVAVLTDESPTQASLPVYLSDTSFSGQATGSIAVSAGGYASANSSGAVLYQTALVISTIAGTGTTGYDGDGSVATSCRLSHPADVAVDATGSIYVADPSHQCIRKINTNGIISTIAGTGVAGYNEDGIAATSAQLNGPYALTVDASGSVYVADTANHRIRKIDTNGIISTIAGTGVSGYNGDGIVATSAQIAEPMALAVDASGNVYVADQSGHRVRKIGTNGIISTIAGTGVAGFSGDGSAATSAKLDKPDGMAVDASGNVYVADCANYHIRKIDTNGIISTIAGTGVAGYNGDGIAATSAQINDPGGMAVDAQGNLYLADITNHRIRKIDTNGIISTIAGTDVSGYNGDGIAATSAQLRQPYTVAVGSHGNLYVADYEDNRVRELY